MTTLTKPGATPQERAARAALLRLLSGQMPEPGGDYGSFTPVVMLLMTRLAEEGPPTVQRVYEVIRRNNPLVRALMEPDALRPAPASEDASGAGPRSSSDAFSARGEGRGEIGGPSAAPPLPEEVALPEEAGAGACEWLDAYLEYSRRWSPLAYEGFHEAVALWLLSTVAARRVLIPFGGRTYTPLFIALVARTSLYAKSTTARIARRTLRAAGLDWLLLPDESTPQKMISEMAGNRVPEDYESLPQIERERLRRSLAFAGQRGWFYEEFGQKVATMSREDGPMAEFRGILRRMNDCDTSYEYGTIGRGKDRIDWPYLALLANMTPADMRPLAKRGAALWADGTWARFAFVTPPAGEERPRGRFPGGDEAIPPRLWEPLKQWHERLGVPAVNIQPVKDMKGVETGHYRVVRGALPEQRCTLDATVTDAYYAYFFALQDLILQSPQDLDGNYVRFPEKALRIAALFASLENDGRIQHRHWARAQAITERWRKSLHALIEQLNETEPSQTVQNEDRILQFVAKRGQVTAREVRQYFKGLDSGQVKATLDSLVRAGMLEVEQDAKTVRYLTPA